MSPRGRNRSGHHLAVDRKSAIVDFESATEESSEGGSSRYKKAADDSVEGGSRSESGSRYKKGKGKGNAKLSFAEEDVEADCKEPSSEDVSRC